MPKQLTDRIKGVEELSSDIYRMTVESEYISSAAMPGQFVNIKCCNDAGPLLRRPISIAGVNRDKGLYEIIFQKKGAGTGILAGKKPGDTLDVLGPLGNHFSLDKGYRRIAVIGGGIGIFPLLFLLNESKAEFKKAYLGFRSADNIVLEHEFRQSSDALDIATDDGSYGAKGLVTDLIKNDINVTQYDMIYTCGPLPMMKSVAEITRQEGLNCQVSMEERMGCGFGACLVCALKTRTNDKHEWKYGHVCKDGPVFNANDVFFE